MAILRRPIRSRPIRPIRLFLIGMFAVPLVSLVGLWAFAASVTAPEAISDHNYNLSGLAVTGPDVATLTIQLPAEQHQTYLWLLSGRKAAKSTLLATRQSIDQVLPGAEAKLKSGDNQPSPVSQEKLTALETDLRNISSIRRSVDAGMMTPAAAFQAYGNIMDAQFQFYYAETLDQGTSLQAIGIGAIDAALEMETVSREATLMDGALNLERGRMDATARQLFDSSATRRQLLMDQALSLLTPGLRAGYVTITRSPAYQQFQAMENQIAASTGSGPVPVNAKEWASDSGVVLGAMLTAEAGISTQLSGISSSASNWLFTKAILAGGIGLFAVLVSVFLLIWFGRKVTGDLTGLYTSVRGMAEERLPRVVERLRRGDDVDVLRAAVAEVEDYVRVDVLSESRDMVAGNAVNDVIHLVAELVENATVFSPPNTRIEVRADRAGTGLVAEVEDRGLGLSQEELDDINRRLASPPEFDLANSEQLGLFVVSRLAARHAIKVSLRQSVYGGTSAILLLPFGVIVREEEAVPGASQADWPGDGREPTDAALPPAAGGSAHSVPLPAFDAAGRHRLPAAATGRRADTDVSARDEEDRSAVRHPLPRPPWEYAQSEPQRPQASPSPEPRETPPADRPPWEQESDTSWFQPVSRTAAGWNTDRSGEDPPFSAPTAQFEQRAAADAASSASHLGMPVRVPQASLAPQLRTQGDDGQQANQQPKAMATNVDARSPEATRNMMILMQQGWERGRVDDLDEPAGISDNGTEQ
jgi:signal transduction histidine kinase